MPGIAICTADTTVHGRSDFGDEALGALSSGDRVEVVRARGAWCRVALPGGVEGFTRASALARIASGLGAAYLLADRGLHALDVEAAPERCVEATGGGRAGAVARAWNLYGGLLGPLAERIGIDPAAAVAVLVVESSGQGFGPDGRVIIRFENHIFRRYLGAERRAEFDRHFEVGGEQAWMGHRYRPAPSEPWKAFHGSQALEWDALAVARRLDEHAALSSISMGLPQVMGFNHRLVGYDHPGHMLAFMGADVRFQLLALFDFIQGGRANSRAVVALRRGDYDTFASLYNGPGQAQYYGDLIEAHVGAFRSLRPASTTTATQASTTSTTSNGSPASSAGRTYEVRPGDTLGAIAGRFGVTVTAIAALNGIANPNLIHAGQVLRLPGAQPAPTPPVVPAAPPEDVDAEGEPRGGETYVVVAGDTLGAIAQRTGCPVPALAQANGIKDVNLIFPGQVLVIPRE